jgi:chromosome segregation ATPase
MVPGYIALAIALIVLLLPFALLFFVIRAVQEKRRRIELESDRARIEAAGKKAVAIGQQLLSEKNELAARIKGMEERFKPVVDLDAECAALRAKISEWTADIEALRASYSEKKAVYDRLAKEVAIFDDKLAFAEMGVYEPHFDFTDSEEYKRNIEVVRAAQKAMVSDKTAVICPTQWHVEGSFAKGKVMTNRNIRLTLRAFNNECDAAIANTRWNNINAMEKRIANAFTQVNKLNESNHISITVDYVKLKFQELFLSHEYREKLKAEREERAEAARLQREEQKLIRDMERAEEEEARYQRLLDKAKSEAQSIVGPQLDAFQDQIKLLEKDLAEAHAKVERAQAMAEKTRSGYVYIISNIGSFGDDIVKIGLTRRLDPTDRVRELGDASVPFVFDTHAIIYSDDAPYLERALHAEFEPVRVNAQNYRKEFFRAKLDDVEAAVKRLAPDAPFFKDIEAQEYRETLVRRNAALLVAEAQSVQAFPDAI